MKKALSLLLALVMLLTLCACGMSKEEMLAQAEVVDWENFAEEYNSNDARAKEKFDDKVVIISNFTADDVTTNDVNGKSYISTRLAYKTISVYLSEDDMLKVSKGETYTVVGILEVHAGNVHKFFGDARLKDAYIVD